MSNAFASAVFGWIITLVAPACLFAAPDDNTRRNFSPPSSNQILQTEFVVIHPIPERWESLSDDMYENRGIAQIERIAPKYMLTISCGRIHQVFIYQNPEVALKHYVGKFVRARYTYAEVKKRVQCIKEPCHPATKRKIVIHSLEETIASEAARAHFEKECVPRNH